jgi:hypothetical protein
MTIRVSTSLRNLAFLSIAAAGLTLAQTASTGALTGSYVFSERGNATATLASLTLAADGSASGTAVVQQGFQVSTYAVQGTYVTNANNSKTLTLAGPSLDTVDVNGNPLVFSEVLMVIPVSSNSFATLRTDMGQNVGQLTAAGQGLAAGSYQINGRPVDPADTSVELVNLGSGGSISGQKITNAFGQIVQKALSGNITVTPTGFQQITVNASFTDANGDPQTATETYLALATQNDIRMVQTGGGAPGLLTLSK